MIVNDVEQQRQIAPPMPQQLGYSIAVVYTGTEAVEYLENQNVDLLLLDMVMEPVEKS